MDGVHMPSLHEINTSGGSRWKPSSHSVIANWFSSIIVTLPFARVTSLHPPKKRFYRQSIRCKLMSKILTFTRFKDWSPYSKVASLNIITFRLISFITCDLTSVTLDVTVYSDYCIRYVLTFITKLCKSKAIIAKTISKLYLRLFQNYIWRK